MRHKVLFLHLGAACVATLGCTAPWRTDPFSPGIESVTPAAFGSGSDRAIVELREPLSVDRAVEIALRNNPGIRAAGFEVDQAAATQAAVESQLLPSAYGISSYSHTQDPRRISSVSANGGQGVFGRDLIDGEIVVRYPVFTGWRISSEINEAGHARRVQEHRLAWSRKSLVFRVHSLFLAILAQRKVLEALDYSSKAMDEHLSRVKDLVALRKAAKVDQLRIEVRLADLAQKRERERNALSILERMLANALGIADRPMPPIEGRLADVLPPEVADGIVEDLVGIAEKQRDDLHAARSALEARAARIDSVSAAHWPEISVFGSAGGRFAVSTTDQPAGMSRFDDFGTVGLSLRVPIFDGGSTQARARRERAALMAERERLVEARLRIRLEVETAALDLASARRRIEATAKAIEQAAESLRIERERNLLGKGSVTEVLDAEAALTDMKTANFRALSEFWTARKQLELAIGEIR